MEYDKHDVDDAAAGGLFFGAISMFAWLLADTAVAAATGSKLAGVVVGVTAFIGLICLSKRVLTAE